MSLVQLSRPTEKDVSQGFGQVNESRTSSEHWADTWLVLDSLACPETMVHFKPYLPLFYAALRGWARCRRLVKLHHRLGCWACLESFCVTQRLICRKLAHPRDQLCDSVHISCTWYGLRLPCLLIPDTRKGRGYNMVIRPRILTVKALVLCIRNSNLTCDKEYDAVPDQTLGSRLGDC